MKPFHFAPLILTSVIALPSLGFAANVKVTPSVSSDIVVASSGVAIVAPSTVDPDAEVIVDLTGAQAGGRLELWGPVTTSGIGGRITESIVSGQSVAIIAPSAPGSYELRYVSPSGALIDRKAFDVAAVPIFLSLPHALGAGIDTQVEWRGPGYPGDMIQIYDITNGIVVAEVPAIGKPGAMNVATIRGPENFGDYSVRYWSSSRNAALRSLSASVTESGNWLSTPIEVFAGDQFNVTWNGPVSPEYSFRIIDPSAGSIVIDVPSDARSTVALTAPARPGAYRVQFVNAATNFILADLPLDVDAN